MKTKTLAPLLLAAFLTVSTAPAFAAEEARPDDRVILDLATEGWVNTKTARVMVGVEAAMNGNAAGTMRDAMTKAVGELAKSDWRLTSMNRSQDQTGMERWSAVYEARLNEADLNGLNEKTKKASKPGMQLMVHNIDFTPTLEETQNTQNQLRVQIYKMANEQLTALNTSLQGRAYRIAMIDFIGDEAVAPRAYMAKNARAMTMAAQADSMEMAGAAPMERSEKLTLRAKVVLAALPPAGK